MSPSPPRLTLASVLLGAAFLSAPASPSPPALFELPAPTGAFPVGTTTWYVADPGRPESLAPGSGPREVAVHAWYPAAAAKGERAPYLREGLPEAQVFARLLRRDPAALDGLASVATHSSVDAPVAPRPARLPVLLFSHGYTALPSSYTALLEDLASHGFAVLSVVHPYEATAATLSGGRVASLVDADGQPNPAVAAVFAEWAVEDRAMAEVTASGSEAERLQRLRSYLARIPSTNLALRRWVDDLTLVLDRLPRLPASAAAGRLARRLDLGRLGVFGHSMGGVTAGQFCDEDRRCRAGLNLDGSPQYGTMIDRPMKAPFLMVYSARPGRTGASDEIYKRGAARYERVDVAGSLHLDFSDMVFWSAALPGLPIFGKLPPGRAVEITRTVVREYFERELLGRPAPTLGGRSPLPGVKVQAFTREPEGTKR